MPTRQALKKLRKSVITVIIFAAILAVAGFFCKIVYESEKKGFDESKKADLQLQATAVSTILSYLISDDISDLKYISQYLGDRNNIKRIVPILKNAHQTLLKSDEYLMNIGFIDLKGNLRYLIPEEFSSSVGNNYANRDYFKKVSRYNKVVLSESQDYFEGQGENLKYESIVAVILPVFSNGEKVGYLVSDVNVSRMAESIQLDKSMKINSNVSFYMINTETGQILCSPKQAVLIENLTWEQIKKNKEFNKSIIKLSQTLGREHSVLVNISGCKYYISVSGFDVEDNSLAVLAVIPYDKTISYSADFIRKMFFVFIFIFLIVILIAGFIIYHGIIVKKLKTQISRLEIFIDQKATATETQSITETEYFKDLTEKIKKLK